MAQGRHIRLTWQGLPQFNQALQRVGRNAGFAAMRALYREAERIMTDSKSNYVPVDTGALRATGHVELPVIRGRLITVTLGYNTPYALVQHENLQYHHTVGGPKYLERPLRAALTGMDARLAADIRGKL